MKTPEPRKPTRLSLYSTDNEKKVDRAKSKFEENKFSENEVHLNISADSLIDQIRQNKPELDNFRNFRQPKTIQRKKSLRNLGKVRVQKLAKQLKGIFLLIIDSIVYKSIFLVLCLLILLIESIKLSVSSTNEENFVDTLAIVFGCLYFCEIAFRFWLKPNYRKTEAVFFDIISAVAIILESKHFYPLEKLFAN